MAWNITNLVNTIQTTLYNETVNGRLSNDALGLGPVAVGNTWLNEVESFPYVYVEAGRSDAKTSATRQNQITHNVQLGIAYESNESLSDARTKARLLLDDGNGNGLLNILTDPANYSWGGLVSYSNVVSATPYDRAEKQPTTDELPAVAYFVVMLEAIEFQDVSGTLH